MDNVNGIIILAGLFSQTRLGNTLMDFMVYMKVTASGSRNEERARLLEFYGRGHKGNKMRCRSIDLEEI